MSFSTGYYLGQSGVRISTIVHVGGDAVPGLRIPDVALMFEADPRTEASSSSARSAPRRRRTSPS
ncbi:MAG TPA: hypothetical protein VFF69_01795 [Phycisphaerales bacterium]|nr:hypothetical protein [Phycisphaerales bacterium]